MTGRLRLIDTGVADAAWNVAVSEALLGLHAEGAIPGTLRLHRYRPCLLLGASQTAAARPGVAVARRVTGGGTVAMTPGVLAWDLLTDRAVTPEMVCRALTGALARLGVRAAFRPPGSVLAGARKLAGTAGAFEGRSRLHQGSLLVDCDAAGLSALMGVPRLPVVTLADCLGRRPDMAEVAELVARALAATLRLRLHRDELSRAERDRAGLAVPA